MPVLFFAVAGLQVVIEKVVRPFGPVLICIKATRVRMRQICECLASEINAEEGNQDEET
jgi:hypothetical protein